MPEEKVGNRSCRRAPVLVIGSVVVLSATVVSAVWFYVEEQRAGMADSPRFGG